MGGCNYQFLSLLLFALTDFPAVSQVGMYTSGVVLMQTRALSWFSRLIFPSDQGSTAVVTRVHAAITGFLW